MGAAVAGNGGMPLYYAVVCVKRANGSAHSIAVVCGFGLECKRSKAVSQRVCTRVGLSLVPDQVGLNMSCNPNQPALNVSHIPG